MIPVGTHGLEFDLGRLHHVGIVVDDIETAAEHFADVYGVSVSLGDESEYRCRIDGATHTTVQRLGLTVEGPPHIELLRTVPGSSVWQPAPGVHHLGFVVDDLARASEELERRGSPLWVGGLHGDKCPFGTAYHRDRFGVTVELLDRRTEARLAARFLGK